LEIFHINSLHTNSLNLKYKMLTFIPNFVFFGAKVNNQTLKFRIFIPKNLVFKGSNYLIHINKKPC